MALSDDSVPPAEPQLLDPALRERLEAGKAIASIICLEFDALIQQEQASNGEGGIGISRSHHQGFRMKLLTCIWGRLDTEELLEARDTIGIENRYWLLEAEILRQQPHLRHQINEKSTLNDTTQPQTPPTAEECKAEAFSLRGKLLKTGMSQDTLLDIRFSKGGWECYYEYYEIELEHLIKHLLNRLKSRKGISDRYSPKPVEELDISQEIFEPWSEVVKRNDSTEDILNLPGKRRRGDGDGDYLGSEAKRLNYPGRWV